jgi:hypothetical protein
MVVVLVTLSGCKDGNGSGDDDADTDVEHDTLVDGDDAVEDAQHDGDAPDGVPDVLDDLVDVVDEEVVETCTTPGLTVGSVVTVAEPGAVVGGAQIAMGAGGKLGLGWSDAREVDVVANEEVFFVSMSRSAATMSAELQVSDAALVSRPPAVAWMDGAFGLVWGDSRELPAGNIYYASVDADGALVGSETQVTTGGVSAMYVSADFDGENLAVVWTDNRDATMDVYFTLVDSTGEMVGSISRVVDAAGNSYRPRVRWTGAGFTVVWDDTMGGEIWEPHVMLATLDAAGTVSSGPTLISGDAGTANKPTAAWSGSLLAVCWEDFRDAGHEIFCATFDAAGAEQTAPTRITTTSGESTAASLISGPDGFALAWAMEDGTPGDDEIHFALLSESLAVTGGDEDLTDTAGELVSLSLVWTGLGYGISFVEKDSTGSSEDSLRYLPFEYCP